MIDLKARRWTELQRNAVRSATLPTSAFFLLLLSSLPVFFLLVGSRQRAVAQTTMDNPRLSDPLPVDSGATGLQQMLRRLSTTARLMHTTAHPDDEDGGMLTLESRGKGDTVLLLTLNRGEGGQNKV